VAAVLLPLTVTACSSDPEPAAEPPYTVETVKSGFLQPGEVGDGMVQAPEGDQHSHAMYIPPSAVPTCPYVSRSDSLTETVDMYFEPAGAEPTGKFLVQADDYRDTSKPYISQGALVFGSQLLAETAMTSAVGMHENCPREFEVAGAPPEILGTYKVNSRPFQAHGWNGWSQHLVHAYPPGQDDKVYDDQVNVVVQKANAIVFFTYNQVKEIGDVAQGEERIGELLDTALARLG
jgi:hypothetical protein